MEHPSAQRRLVGRRSHRARNDHRAWRDGGGRKNFPKAAQSLSIREAISAPFCRGGNAVGSDEDANSRGSATPARKGNYARGTARGSRAYASPDGENEAPRSKRLPVPPSCPGRVDAVRMVFGFGAASDP